MNDTKRSFNVRKALLGLLALVLVAAISVTATLAYMQKKTEVLTNTFVAISGLLDETSTGSEKDEWGTTTKGKFVLWENALIGSNGSYKLDDSKKVLNGASQNYSVVPGISVPKNTSVHLENTLTDVIVFVEIVEGGDNVWGSAANQLNYAVTNDWTKVTGVTGAHNGTIYAYTPGKEGKGSTGVDCKIEPASTVTDPNKGMNLQILADNQITVGENVTKTNVDGENAKLEFYAYLTQYAGFEEQSLSDIFTGNNFDKVAP